MQNNQIGEYEFRQLLEHIPYMAYWKNITNHQFLWCNKKLADFLGLDEPGQIIGLTGYDFAPIEFVDLLRKHEAIAVKNKQNISVKEEIYHPLIGRTIIEVTIGPILNENNKVSSVICYGTHLFVLADKPWNKVVELIKKENIHQLIKLSKYKINTQHGVVTLSKKEAECVLYMLKGLKSKEIAKEMELASRTVDNHIENIKNKLNCSNRSQLSSILVKGGFIDNFS
jgi:DNA-binding CsgD family transcriptional regulator